MAWIEKTRSGSFRVGWMDPDTHLQKYRGGFATKQEAARFQRDLEVTGPPTELTLQEYAEQVFDSSFDLRGSTLYAYRKTWGKHVSERLGRRRLAELTTLDMRNFFSELEVGPSAKASVYRVLAKMLNSAEREALIPKSPLKPIPKPRDERRREVTPLAIENIESLASTIEPYFRLAVLLAGYAGLRGGEVGGLRLCDVDAPNRQLQIVQATARHGGQRVLGEPKSESSRRRIDVPAFLVDAVIEHVKLYGTAPDGRLFQTPAGALVVSTTLDDALKKVAPGTRFHDLRHTCAALMVAQGAHPKAIQQHLGHSSISITLDVYGHLFEGLGRGVADGLETARRKAQADIHAAIRL